MHRKVRDTRPLRADSRERPAPNFTEIAEPIRRAGTGARFACRAIPPRPEGRGISRKIDELTALVASLAISQKETAEQMKRTDEQMKRTDEKLERIGVNLGNISKNQGDVAEEFFFQSLIKDNRLGSIRFDDITKNMAKHRGKIQEEYDLVMTNDNTIAIVEVKYKVHEHDLNKLDRKMHHFKQLFPIYQTFKQYGAIAAFHINVDAKEEALRRGYFVLQRSGDLIHTESAEHLTVL